MGTGQSTQQSRFSRLTGHVLRIAAALLIFAAGVWAGPRVASLFVRPEESPPVPTWHPESIYDASKGFPRLDATFAEDPRQPEPKAVQARRERIQRDAAAIQGECERAAAGDWERWLKETARYRSDLKAKIDGLGDMPTTEKGPRYFALEGRDRFPLFEINSRLRINYLHNPALLDAFQREQPVVAADRWLRQRGIDLIFVPVPKMTEVYIEHFLDPCPADGIIAPHMRRTLLELLQKDVEVVDGFPLFRSLKDLDAEYLYNTADTHWAPRGMRIMAKEIADRIQRYKFGTRARFALPLVRVSLGPYDIRGNIGAFDRFGESDVLTPEQQEIARPVQTTTLGEVRTRANWPLPNDLKSPVLVIGNSFAFDFWQQLVKELNLFVQTRCSADQTTEAFADLLRYPELLEHCRVVVWISTEQHLTIFQPLPKPIREALHSDK
jgi:hypothetical protein